MFVCWAFSWDLIICLSVGLSVNSTTGLENDEGSVVSLFSLLSVCCH